MSAAGAEVLLGVSAVLVVGVAGTSQAEATYKVRTHGAKLIVRDDQGNRVGAVPNGAGITINCQKHGPTISDGFFGATDLWDEIAPGRFVSDAYVQTGSRGMVALECAATTPKPEAAPPAQTPVPASQPIDYRFVHHNWYDEILFNRSASNLAAEDTNSFCDDLADIPAIGVGEKYLCRIGFGDFRRTAQEASAQGRCVRWIIGLHLVPKPDSYVGEFCADN